MRWTWIVVVAGLVALAGGELQAEKGGSGKPGGGGKPADGGGGTADPAIVYVDAPDLMVMDADGGNATVLTSDVAWSATPSIRPHWSPDGEWVVFNSAGDRLDGPGLYVVKKDGTGLTKVVSTTQLPHDPAWCPENDDDGNYLIAYSASEPYGPNDLFLVRLDPDSMEPVDADPLEITDTEDDWSDTDISWAPDGRTLASFRKKYGAGKFDLALYQLGGSLPIPAPIIKVVDFVGTFGVVGQALDFANGSNKLAMIGRVGNDYDLYTLDLGSDTAMVDPEIGFEEEHLLNVTKNATDDELHPRWSPDDMHLVFARNAPQQKNDGIEVIDEDGTDPTRLLKGPSSALDWRP